MVETRSYSMVANQFIPGIVAIDITLSGGASAPGREACPHASALHHSTQNDVWDASRHGGGVRTRLPTSAPARIRFVKINLNLTRHSSL